VLAGGGSTRFGRDKALAEIEGKPMVSRIAVLLFDALTQEVCIVGASSKYGKYAPKCVEDRWPGQGPLGGIVTALLETADNSPTCAWNLIVSCDMPFLTGEMLVYCMDRAKKSAAEVVVPRSAHGLEPLCACWRTSVAAKVRHALEQGVRKVTDAMKHLKVEVLDEADWKRFDNRGRLFWNMNTPADYDEAKRILKMEQA
jgi:molybdopterin-guanine dinucleotide biosynthesis protein A